MIPTQRPRQTRGPGNQTWHTAFSLKSGPTVLQNEDILPRTTNVVQLQNRLAIHHHAYLRLRLNRASLSLRRWRADDHTGVKSLSESRRPEYPIGPYIGWGLRPSLCPRQLQTMLVHTVSMRNSHSLTNMRKVQHLMES